MLPASSSPLRILLIEDNPGDALLLEETMHETAIPFTLHRCERLQEGIDAAQMQSFDTVLLDLSLPDSAGTATIARAGKVFWKTPLVVLTALDDDQMGLKSLQFGAQDYLVKSQVTGPLLARSLRYAKERHRERERLRQASLIDELTGLYNRRGFVTVAREELALAAEEKRDALVVFADLDGLKPVNDTHGHAAGDWAIGKAADALKLVFSSHDVVGRIGGDEFVALTFEAEANAEERLRAALDGALEKFNREGGKPYRLGISLGFHRPAFSGAGDAPDLDAILGRADEALYAAKRARKAQAQGGPASGQ